MTYLRIGEFGDGAYRTTSAKKAELGLIMERNETPPGQSPLQQPSPEQPPAQETRGVDSDTMVNGFRRW